MRRLSVLLASALRQGAEAQPERGWQHNSRHLSLRPANTLRKQPQERECEYDDRRIE